MRLLILLGGLLAAPAIAQVVGQPVDYEVDGQSFRGYVAYDTRWTTPRPGVLVVHEWWGHNAYARQRANMLAGEGFVAMALDMYGEGRNTGHPEQAKAFMQAVTQQQGAVARRFEAARALLASRPGVRNDDIAAIGYCFGGGVVLNLARQGVDLDGVVSFHGSLGTENPAQAGDRVTPMLVLNGEADPFVPPAQVKAFREEMRAAGADLTYVGYPGIQHSFTNPGADAVGAEYGLPLAYDRAADEDSWSRALAFLRQRFDD